MKEPQKRPQLHIERTEKLEHGKAVRNDVPRESHGKWEPKAKRHNPVAQLRSQDKTRVKDLLPIKYGRMLTSPFAFYRGSAIIMAADLATMATTKGLDTQLCGDAHLSNFGLFASRERTLVFDINDFDETYPGPWEWDLKRLAVSIVLAGRHNGFSDRACKDLVAKAVKTYREFMAVLAPMHSVDLWHIYIDAEQIRSVFEKGASKAGKKKITQATQKAGTNTREQSIAKLTRMDRGERKIISKPPLVASFSDMLIQRIDMELEREKLTLEAAKRSFKHYLKSLSNERRHLLSHFKIVDGALKVGGVGSVGTRCLIVLLEGDSHEEALILQLKEAGSSILEPYCPKVSYRSNAERVVRGQRLMQATSDAFLGWGHRLLAGTSFYWRQFKDMKGSIDVTLLDAPSFSAYVDMCANCLARAHARAGDPAGITGYLGSSDAFDKAISKFALVYADQVEKDYKELLSAQKLGKIKVESGI